MPKIAGKSNTFVEELNSDSDVLVDYTRKGYLQDDLGFVI